MGASDEANRQDVSRERGSQHGEPCGRETHAAEEQEIGCFEGNRGRKLTGREASEEEERKKADGEEMK